MLSLHQCGDQLITWVGSDAVCLCRARRSGIEAPAGPYPVSPYTPPDPIPAAKLKDVLDNEIPNWSRTESPLPEDPAKRRVELHRSFVFRDFQSAVNFMAQTAPACDITDHHPRWQNIWSTVDIYLSTWDGDLHQITDRDVMLARYFDKVFDEYDPVKTRTITA